MGINSSPVGLLLLSDVEELVWRESIDVDLWGVPDVALDATDGGRVDGGVVSSEGHCRRMSLGISTGAEVLWVRP